ncbi:DUF2892 domain-containing protein [Halomonas sp. 18H]|uniref:YgaP family membrane protein n=1 Tax=Halomonas almeriensis TaxID=308163 RepID=UPI00222FFD92|nr:MULTISPECIES: DUF2892 domain-containing protein [Halomonas]MCW4152738.1 DUF2892 domain-containing protein [Halomonas sp. 18H]MDN3552057.1 DUF2892 domain-containing protein [Halomonas almeriensis]
MKHNIGRLDKWLRIAFGVVLIGLTLSGTLGVWGWLGVLPILTALIGSCPLYSLLGIRTCRTK